MGTAFAVLRVKFEGEDLGDNIASILNKRMRGRIEIGSVSWSTRSLKTVATGGWVPVEIHDIKVWDDCALSALLSGTEAGEARTGDPNEDCTPDDQPDPDPNSRRKPRKLLLRTSLVTAEIDIHALIFGNHDFVFRHVVIHGGEALLEETREPYPLHDYDRVIVSIVTAFYPRQNAGFRAGIYADSAPPVFDIRDIHIKDLNLTVHMRPYSIKGADRVGYGFTARLLGVNVDPELKRNDSYLYMDATNPLVAKFYVRLAVEAAQGTVRILDEGPRAAFRMPHEGFAPATQVYPPKERVASYEIALVDVKLNRLGQMPTEWARRDYIANTLELDLQATTVPCTAPGMPRPDRKDGAQLHITGELDGYWDRPYDGAWNLQLDAKNLGPTVRSCIKSTMGGDDLHGTITLTGPFVASPRIGLDLKNLDVAVPLRASEAPLNLTLAEVHGGIDLVNEQGFIEKTKALIRGGKEPGEVELSATFGLRPYYANAQIDISKAIDVGRFLTPKIVKGVGKFLKGRLRAKGDFELGFALEDFDLALGAAPTSTALRVHKGRLFTGDSFNTIHIENVHVDAGQSRAMFDGKIDLLHEDIDLRIEGNFPDLDVWLRRFDLPAFVTSAGGGSVIIIKGKLKNPRINFNTELAGVPCLDRLRLTDTQFSDGILEIRRMTSQGLGGELTGNGRVRIPEGGGTPIVERLVLSGRRLEASRMCGLGGTAKGTLDVVEAELGRVSIDKNRAPLDWLDHAEVYVKAAKLNVKGEGFSDVAMCVNKKDDAACRPRAMYVAPEDLEKCATAKKTGGSCIVMTAKRDGGGVIDATVAKLPGQKVGKKTQGPQLGGAVSVDLPLAVLDQFIGKGVLGGHSRMTLHLGGTPTAPQADGHITLLRTWVANAFVGDSQLRVEPITLAGGKPGVSIRGSALADRLTINGTLGTTAPYPVELAVTGRRVELDVAADLTRMLGLPEPLQAWVSGTVTVKTELFPAKPVEPEAWVELTEVMATVNHRGADGRITPLRLTVIDQQPGARPAVSLRVTPSSVELACKDSTATGGRVPCTTKFATPAGVVEIRGHATESSVAIEALGTLDLSLLAPLFDNRFDEASGHVALKASVSGTMAKPAFEASIDLDPKNPVRVRPVGGDTVIEAPTGLIKLANGSLGFTDVILQVRDQHLDEKGELHVKGNILLDGLTPANWSVLISGKLAGKMLLVAVPDKISQAGGLATIDGDLILSGKGKLPLISGTLIFDPPADNTKTRTISLIPRGVRRELQFSRGSIDIETLGSGTHRTYMLAINDMLASIDGEGSVSNITGSVELRDGELANLRVSLDADNIPFRIPGTLDLVVSARDVSLEKASDIANLEVRGRISIIDGKYLRNFALTDQIRSIGATTVPAKPFWEEYPTLGNADLRLTLDVRRFQVDNNIAKIDLVGPLIEITNTPRDPRMSGSIRVDRGEFRLPGTRARFTRTSGSVDFAENVKAGDPQLNLVSEAPDYRDLSGQEHLITVTFSGSLSNPQWDLKTSTGYNKSQTLSLLVLGRNQESLRRSLGDQSLGGDPTRVDPSTNPSQGFADQIVKDLAGDWVSGILGDSLGELSGLDVLRIEIGFGSIGLRLEKKLLENTRLIGHTEQTIRGTTIDTRAVLTTSQKSSFQVGYLGKNFYDPAEQDISDRNIKLVYRMFIP
ncbi:MAG: translocation/assembly module TamB domain-containing protein [Deltaproteobacteria bacterium]|nr:translocation/assembly module TamB domain-containing protein [Deltaproteobacteria bacterium]